MAKWTDYTTDTNPTDTDEVMTLDTDKSPKANKRVTLSTLADYFLDKLASKVFAKLETENKTVIGALNELNSNLWKIKNITFTDITIPSSGYITYNEMTYDSEIPKNILFATVFSYGTIEPKYPFTAGTAYIFGVPGCVINNAVITFVFRE